MKSKWKNTDPRDSTYVISKGNNDTYIVICKPSSDKRLLSYEVDPTVHKFDVCIASIVNDYGQYIWANFDDPVCISANGKWDPTWSWVPAPEAIV